MKVRHDTQFDPDKVRLDLGIFSGQWEKFQIEMRRLAAEKIDQDFAEAFLATLLALKSKSRADGTLPNVRQS